MNESFWKKFARIVLRILVGGAFLYAGAVSIHTPEQFSDSVAGYQLLPAQMINLLALSLPPFELFVGAVLITGRLPRVATLSGLILTIVFAIALSSALARGLTIDCGCFGHGKPSRAGMWLSLGRDLLMGAALVWLYAGELRKATANSHPVNTAASAR
jgi:putative oxidoreductase